MKSIFEDLPTSDILKLPEGLLNLDLDPIETASLLVLVIGDLQTSKTETKQVVKTVLSSIPAYQGVKKGTMDKSVDSLEIKNVLQRNFSYCYIDPLISDKIRPFTKKYLPVVKGLIHYFENHYSYSYESNIPYLALLVGDFDMFDKHLNVSRSYSWSDNVFDINSALQQSADMTLIKPFLSKFHAYQRENFLNKIPFLVDSDGFEQLKDVYLDSSINVPIESKYIFSSCAHLLLPINESVQVSKILGLETDSCFFESLLKGDVDKAVLRANSFLSTIQEEENHKRKELPGLYGLLFALVLIAKGDAKSLANAATFLRSTLKGLFSSKEYPNPFKAFINCTLLYINHKLGKKTCTANAIYNAYDSDLHQQFLAIVLSWFGKPLNARLPKHINEKEELEYRASGLAVTNETKAASASRLEVLQNRYGYTPLANIVKAKEVWEDVLSILSNKLVGQKTDTTKVQVKKRLIWLLNPLEEGVICCLEQTRNKSGWSKGKERSLIRLINSIPDFATDNDKAVIACMSKHSYYNQIQIRNWNKLIIAMIEHPDVYTFSEPYLPLNIRREEAKIVVNKSGKGASIELEPKSPYPNVVQETPTSYTYTHWSSEALQVHTVLTENNQKKLIIPEQGMPKTRQIVEALEENSQLAGNLSMPNGTAYKSANIPVVQLTPVNDQLHVQLLVEVVKNEDALYVPGVGAKEVQVVGSDGKKYNVKRNHKVEKEILSELSERISWLQGLNHLSSQLFIEEDEDILDFLSEIKQQAPEVKVIWPKGERLKVAKVITGADIKMNVKKVEDWFAIDGSVTIDNSTKLSMLELLSKSNAGTLKYIQLDDKTYLSICADLQKKLAAFDTVVHQKGKSLLVHPLGSNNIEKLLDDSIQVKTDTAWKQHIKKIDALKDYTPSLPDNLQANLRPYQKEGVYWLDRLHHWGVGACLADDMGLGKTLQSLSIMLKYANNGPSLVLAPASVCNNWVKEIMRFTPTLKAVELKSQNRESHLDNLKAYNVLVVSYGLLQANPDLLSQRQWNIVLLDEAHAIKNAKSVRSKAVMKLQASFKIITTGTPIQNHLGELWNLLQFINPGMLGSREQFADKYMSKDTDGIAQNKRKLLSKYIAPFILRRHKNEVLDDLPEKTEITLQVDLSEKERALYETARNKAIEQISGVDANVGSRHMQILAEITRLRQLSCNPQLLMPNCDIPSSKLETLEMLVDDLRNAGHKALIFSQFTKHLGLIRQMLDKNKVSYQYLDGSTSMKHREQAIDLFQQGKSDLFLISLKAGGVGLNLTAADYVIHMDPWWNPAIEDQASDRAHRIGQQRPVTIYRIIAKNTIEEKIVKLHHEKRDLADKLLANTDQSAAISSNELFELINESFE